MKNITVLDTGIDVSGVLEQLKKYPEDWGIQNRTQNTGNLVDSWGFPAVDVGVLQLIMGGVTKPDEFVGDTEYCIPTDAYKRHTEVLSIVGRYTKHISRCGFLSLPVGGKVGTHIDIGSYYQTRNRYHLSIKGTYKYHVGDEELIITPGMLVWFNNKLPHGTENIGQETRITFVFDVKKDMK